jgi:hypothetical protein
LVTQSMKHGHISFAEARNRKEGERREGTN